MAAMSLRPFTRRQSDKASSDWMACSMEELPYSNKGSASTFEVPASHEEKVSANCTMQRIRILGEMKKFRAITRAKSTSSLLGRVDTAPSLMQTSSVVSLPACGTAASFWDDAGAPTPGRRLLAGPVLPALDNGLEASALSPSLRPRSTEVQLLGRSKSMPQLSGVSGVQTADIFARVPMQTTDESLPASTLDLMDSPKASSRASDVVPTIQFDVAFGDALYAVPFDVNLKAWANAPEALGELFATKLLEIGTTGKGAAVSKAPKKSKKSKDVSATAISNSYIEAAEWSTEELLSAEEVFPVATKPTGSKPASARRSRRRPSSTGSLRRHGAKGRLLEHSPCSLSCDDTLWLSQSRRTLQPLPKVPEAHLAEDIFQNVQPPTDVWVNVCPKITQLMNDNVGEDCEALCRPLTATVNRVADPNLWNIGFNDNDSTNDSCAWDCDREIYCAWGGNGEVWADVSDNGDDWGADATDIAF